MSDTPAEPIDALRRAVQMVRAGKARRAISAIHDAVGSTEVIWNGCRFRVTPKDNATDRHLWEHGVPDEGASIDALLRVVAGQKVRFFDIGGNSGLFSVAVAHHAAPGSMVTAFEPNPVMAARLRDNVALNDLGSVVTVEECALGDTPGEATLNIFEGNLGRATLFGADPRAKDRQISVPVGTLDTFWPAQADDRLGVFKLDVEGHEAAALAPWLQAMDRFASVHHILMEVTHSDRWSHDVVGDLRDAGYAEAFRGEGNVLMSRV
ncbi:MAG: FkbM family methyltransferase [Pseudomonadota bacterium]